MPCTYSRDYASEFLERLNEVTALLCALCLEVDGTSIGAVPGLAEWWTEHKAADARRAVLEAEEKLRVDVTEVIAGLLQWEKRVLLGDIDGWGAAVGAAIETLKGKGLWRTRLGDAVATRLQRSRNLGL